MNLRHNKMKYNTSHIFLKNKYCNSLLLLFLEVIFFREIFQFLNKIFFITIYHFEDLTLEKKFQKLFKEKTFLTCS